MGRPRVCGNDRTKAASQRRRWMNANDVAVADKPRAMLGSTVLQRVLEFRTAPMCDRLTG